MNPQQVDFCSELLRLSMAHEAQTAAEMQQTDRDQQIEALEGRCAGNALTSAFFLFAVPMPFCTHGLAFVFVEALAALGALASFQLLLLNISDRRELAELERTGEAPRPNAASAATLNSAKAQLASAKECSIDRAENGFVLSLDTGATFSIANTPEIVDLMAAKALAFTVQDRRVSADVKLDGMRRIHPSLLT